MDTISSDSSITDTPVSDTGNQAVDVLLNLEGMIKTSITTIDKSKEQLKKFNEMLTGVFANDPTYQEHEKAAKEANKIKNATKSQLMKQPAAMEASLKVKELRGELKDMQAGLSDYLREYQRMSGNNEIEGEDGEVREIVYTAKLIKRSSRFVK